MFKKKMMDIKSPKIGHEKLAKLSATGIGNDSPLGTFKKSTFKKAKAKKVNAFTKGF